MRCDGCGQESFLIPLHGGKGGPMRCPLCVGKWNGEHGRRRRAGRVVIRAMKAFLDAGGKHDDLDKLKISTIADGVLSGVDPLGYMDGIARLDSADIDLTSELLTDALKLTHPDHHPPERRELAQRVTQGLLALQPFVFPAPKPGKPASAAKRHPEARSRPDDRIKLARPSQSPQYPCIDCADAVPSEYCDACRAEWEKRENRKYEQQTAKQRAEYAQRRQRLLAKRPTATCAVCGESFKAKRDDARFCSDRCRQQAHRKPVTDKNRVCRHPLFNRDKCRRAILAVLDRHRAVFLNDLLPETRTRAQYQAVSLAAARLEADGKIDLFSYSCRFNRPGHKVLLKRGHTVSETKEIHQLTDSERLK